MNSATKEEKMEMFKMRAFYTKKEAMAGAMDLSKSSKKSVSVFKCKDGSFDYWFSNEVKNKVDSVDMSKNTMDYRAFREKFCMVPVRKEGFDPRKKRG